MRVRFLSPAEEELAEAATYYQSLSPRLGVTFVEEIGATVDRILLHPTAWTRVSEHHRRCLTRRFPFGLIYTVGDDEIVVVSVMNLRRKPSSWKDRAGYP